VPRPVPAPVPTESDLAAKDAVVRVFTRANAFEANLMAQDNSVVGTQIYTGNQGGNFPGSQQTSFYVDVTYTGTNSDTNLMNEIQIATAQTANIDQNRVTVTAAQQKKRQSTSDYSTSTYYVTISDNDNGETSNAGLVTVSVMTVFGFLAFLL
jgi:hypothetical protein